MSRKRKTVFVIFGGPQQHGSPGTRYVAKDGTVTDSKVHAAKFYSFADAEEFAREKQVTLTATRYIGQEEFTDFEINSVAFGKPKPGPNNP